MDLTLQAEADYKVDVSYEIGKCKCKCILCPPVAVMCSCACSEVLFVLATDTRDHEDHTYNGIMFLVKCQSVLPLMFIEISEIWVRGDLGPMTVWTTPDTFEDKHEHEENWDKIYDTNLRPSRDTLVPLTLTEPVRLKRGESLGVYVHSGLVPAYYD